MESPTEKLHGTEKLLLQLAYDDAGLLLTHPHYIRLLESVSNNGMLHYKLSVANLRKKPVYRALSYTWGPARGWSETRHSDNVPRNEQRCRRIVSLQFVFVFNAAP